MGKWFIAEWREAWRFSSLWAATVGFGALVVWNQMPSVVRARVPDTLEFAIGGLLWASVLLARLVKQPTSQAKIDAKRAAARGEYNHWVDQARG